MARGFDPGYGAEPFATLVADVPGAPDYPANDFRLEWGPIFHRGRLDGSARVLVLGQDPAQHETILRRILVGEAGHRLQGFLWKLGIERSYVMVNTFVYSVYGQNGGSRNKHNPKIAAYRNRWLAALLQPGKIDAVVALGTLADTAWQDFLAAPEGSGVHVAYRHITHPTAPESAGGTAAQHAAAIKAMLENWNEALAALQPLPHPDSSRRLVKYGAAFKANEKKPIPDIDTPPWAPGWMTANDGWAQRTGTGIAKRRQILVTVPRDALP